MTPMFTIHAGEYIVGSHIETDLLEHNRIKKKSKRMDPFKRNWS